VNKKDDFCSQWGGQGHHWPFPEAIKEGGKKSTSTVAAGSTMQHCPGRNEAPSA